MEHWLELLKNYLIAHPYLGLLIVFFVSFIESLPLLGTIFPGSIIMTMVGILIGRNVMPFFLTLSWSIAGAFVGDVLSFALGKYYKEKIIHIWPFNKNPKWLAWGESFFERHGGKSILIGRFVGPARSTIPLIAGLMNLKWSRFIPAAVLATFLWAVIYILPGILIGAVSLQLPPGRTTRFIFISLGILVLLWFIYWLLQRFFKLIVTSINRAIDHLWDWLSRHHRSQFFVRFITNRSNPLDHHQLTLSLLSILFFILFLTTLINVLTVSVIAHVNLPIFHFLQSIRSISWDKFFVAITFLGDTKVVNVCTIFFGLGLLFRKKWRSLYHLLGLLAVVIISGQFFKWITHSPRPAILINGLFTIPHFDSFPSGHALFSIAIYGFIAFLITKQLSKRWRPNIFLTIALIIFLISFSRIYLGAHWLIDILGGWFLGLFLLLATIVSFQRKPEVKKFKVYNWILLIIALTIPYAIYGTLHWKTYLRNFTPDWPEQQISIREWWESPLNYLPPYRLDRFGSPMQPFNIQWAEDLERIKQTLKAQGFQSFENQPQVKAALSRLINFKENYFLTLFPELYRQKRPVLFMIKPLFDQGAPHNGHLPNKVLEIKLWSTGVYFTDSHLPLWIGTIDTHMRPETFISFKKHSLILLNDGDSIEGIIQAIGFTTFNQGNEWIGSSKSQKIKIVKAPLENLPKELLHRLDWDGKILLIRKK